MGNILKSLSQEFIAKSLPVIKLRNDDGKQAFLYTLYIEMVLIHSCPSCFNLS